MFVAPFLIFVVDELDDFPIADFKAHGYKIASKNCPFLEAYIKAGQWMNQYFCLLLGYLVRALNVVFGARASAVIP